MQVGDITNRSGRGCPESAQFWDVRVSPRSGAQTPEVTFLGAQSPLQGGAGWGGLQPQAIQKTLKREHSVPRTNLLSPVAHFSPHPELAAQSPNPTEEAPQRLRGQGTRRPAPKATRAQGIRCLCSTLPTPPAKTLSHLGSATSGQRSGHLGAVTTHWRSEAQPRDQAASGLSRHTGGQRPSHPSRDTEASMGLGVGRTSRGLSTAGCLPRGPSSGCPGRPRLLIPFHREGN